MKIDRIIKKLEKFHGKPTEIEIENDDEEKVKFKIYQLPMKYMPLLSRVQMYYKKLGIKEGSNEEPDLSKLSSAEFQDYSETLKDLVSTTFAFSMCVDEGIFNYTDVDKGLPTNIVEKVKEAVEMMGVVYLNKLSKAIFEANAGEEKEGDAQKKSDRK